jgi:hypothetical protein
MFYEAVKVDMGNSKDISFNNTISSTLSLTTVLFEDLSELPSGSERLSLNIE